jgi:hypothetical protein
MSIPTAEEFLQNYKNDSDHYADQDYSEGRLIKALQEFAKMHVTAALKEASEKATVTPIDHEEISEGSFRPIWGVDDDSILNSYPLENIK